MKKLILITICVSFLIGVKGQEIFKVPDLTVEQKHNSMVSMFWYNVAPGISFVKTQNVSPYEYGAYYGKLFAPYWDSEIGFKSYAQGILRNWSYFTYDTDSGIIIEEESDSTLIFKVPPGAFYNYFKDGRNVVSAEEMLQMMNGSHEQIAGQLGCTSKMVLEKEWVVVTVKKNK